MNLNKIFLIGNITKEIDLKTTSGGNTVATFGLATNRTWKDKSGKKQEQATFHNIVAWGKTAEVIHQFCNKGSLLMIEGRVDNRSYEKKDGSGKGYISEVIVENFQFGPSKQQTSAATSSRKEIKDVDEDNIPIIEDGKLPLDQDSINISDIPF